MVKKCHAHTLNPIRCQQCQQAEHCHHRSAQLSWSRLLHAAVGGMLTVMTFMTVMIPPSVLSERESGQLDRVLALKGVEGFKTTTPWRVGWITSAAFALTMDTPEIQSSSQDTVKTIEPVVNTLDPFDAAENLKNDASGSSGSSELPELQESVLRISAMGTSGVLRIATPALIPEDELDQLQADLVVALETLEQDLSTWNRDSALSRFNDSPSTDFTVVPSSLVVLTELTQAISKTTDGLYDTTVAPLVDLWGFGVEISPVVPSAEQINALLPIVGWQGIQTDRATNSIRKKKSQYKNRSEFDCERIWG